MAEIRKNDEFEIEINDISDEGLGIGRRDGFIWFVKDAVIEDRVLAAATKLKKNYGFARTVKIIRPSDDRVEASCAVSRSCGGCQLGSLDYRAQLRFKEEKVINDIKRIGGFDTDALVEAGTLEIDHIIGMEDPYHYRNKSNYPIGLDKNGRIVAGFYAGRTHSIIECRDCKIGAPENRQIIDAVIEFMEEQHIAPYDEQTGRGIVRHVMIRKAFNTGEVMVCIVINADRLKASERLIDRLKPMVTSLSLSVNKENTNVIMGERIINLYGRGYIEEEIRRKDGTGLRFRISPLSFFQVNSLQMEELYASALEFAGLNGTENVWDLYCGAGTISLFLAAGAAKVYGVEIVPPAIENARENAEINGLSDKTEFFTGKSEEVLPKWYAEHPDKRIDVIVTDPPRKGCEETCLETMVKMAPERIVYVSCDPATLARDLKYLCANGYELKRIRPVDMFPQTVHVETVVLLSKAN